MKKVAALTIALCLVFGSVLPVYAAWGDSVADRQNLSAIRTEIEALVRVFTGAAGTMYNSISEFLSWITPSGSFGSGGTISGLNMYEIMDYIAWNIDTDWNTEFAQLNTLPSVATNTLNTVTNLDDLEKSLTNYFRDAASVNVANRKLNSHLSLVNSSISYALYERMTQDPYGSYTDQVRYSWLDGSPLGNIAFILQHLHNQLIPAIYDTNMIWFTGANNSTVLSVWDSQGDVIDQEFWSPTSGLNGLYKYLAYMQRDIARLTYAYASDEELEAREFARANQVSVFDNFIDPSSSAAAMPSDFDNLADISSGIQSGLRTGRPATGIFDVFTGDHSDQWFSQDTANQLMGIRSTRDEKSSTYNYNTPLLDKQMEELLSLFGGDEK